MKEHHSHETKKVIKICREREIEIESELDKELKKMRSKWTPCVLHFENVFALLWLLFHKERLQIMRSMLWDQSSIKLFIDRASIIFFNYLKESLSIFIFLVRRWLLCVVCINIYTLTQVTLWETYTVHTL